MPPCDYEKQRLKNIEDNRKILAEIGLLNPYRPFTVTKKSVKRRRVSYLITSGSKDSSFEQSPSHARDRRQRRSSRLLGLAPAEGGLLDDGLGDDLEEEEPSQKRHSGYLKHPNVYGEIPDVDVGTSWATRLECSAAGIHRPTVAGIHGDTEDGAYSIALSGGYEDNIDLGDCFTYTGEGGRDLKGTANNPKNLRTAAQTKDQTLSRGNLALSQSVETGQPVRVIRGYKLNSPFAPEDGYRYDGLYNVTKCWYTTGLAGFGVWKFALKRCDNQAQPPWVIHTSSEETQKQKTCQLNSVTDSDTAMSDGSLER